MFIIKSFVIKHIHQIIHCVISLMYADHVTTIKVVLLTLNMLNILNELVQLPFLGLFIINFEYLKFVSQQYRAWSDCTDVQAGLALYWWPRPNAFGSSTLRVKSKYVSKS
jgi:hypothetical protein